MQNKLNYAVTLLMLWLICYTTTAGTMRDPTEPPSGGAISQASDHFMLSSILLSSQGNVAVINGEIVGVGDQVGNAKVIRIIENQVVLLHYHKQIILYLVQEKIRQD